MTVSKFNPVELFSDIKPGWIFRFTDIQHGPRERKLKCQDVHGEPHYVDLETGVVFDGSELANQTVQTLRKAP